MAYEIGRKRVRDTEEFNDFALGLRLPIKAGNGGFFEQNFTTIDQAKSNIQNLMLTRQGERLIQTEFGTGLSRMLFEQMNAPDFEDRVVDTIETALNTWLPYITLEDIELDLSAENLDRNKVDVTIFFRVGTDINTESVTFTVEE